MENTRKTQVLHWNPWKTRGSRRLSRMLSRPAAVPYGSHKKNYFENTPFLITSLTFFSKSRSAIFEAIQTSNAINQEMSRDLTAYLQKVRQDNDIRVA